jgi:hypothetical protein
MKNRIAQLLSEWRPESLPADHADPPPLGQHPPRGPYRMPRSVNMLMPVELCVNRNLLVSLLSASITEMNRHQRSEPSPLSKRDQAELEATLQQHLAFRTWLKDHPSGYISIALYPVSDTNPPDDLGDPGDLPS